MKKLSGYVLVKETNAGVPHLVVAAFDAENPIQLGDERGIPAQVIQRLGKRIGSVLTDQEGKFTLASEDLEFPGNESRPDLVILVFAPEDVQTSDDPYPLSPEKRILYISAVPRTDAGAEEAFVIRLLQSQLNKFQISASASTRHSETDSNRFVNAIESTWEFRDTLQNKLKARLQTDYDHAKKRHAEARQKVKHLSGIPLHLRNGGRTKNALRNNDFLISDRKELAKTLASLQTRVVTDGLKGLDNSKYPPTLRLHLTEEDLEYVGLKREKGTGKITGKVDSKKLTKKLLSHVNGVDLVRIRGLNNPSPDQLAKKYLANVVQVVASRKGKPTKKEKDNGKPNDHG